MPAKRKLTLAEIVEEVRATPRPPIAVRKGSFNSAGQLFDPAGAPLTPVKNPITPARAAELVAEGALVAFEGCGCGGFAGGCQPEWADSESLTRLTAADNPRFVKGYGSPTWIDEWSSDSSTVVFLHGDVEWGDEY